MSSYMLVLVINTLLIMNVYKTSTLSNGSITGTSHDFDEFVKAIAISERHTRIITFTSTSNNLHHKFRLLNSMGHYIKTWKTLEHQETLSDNKIICFVNVDEYDLDDTEALFHNSSHQMNSGEWYMIGSDDKIHHLINNLQVGVDQKLFFVSISSMEVHESYVIGQTRIVNQIGQLKETIDRKLVFVLNPYLPSFLERRSDLKGQKLLAFTNFQAPFVFLSYKARNKMAESESGWFYLDNGYEYFDVRNDKDLTGMFVDILDILEESMNFTAVLLKSRDDKSFTFGSKINGTWDGMIGELFRGHADFIFAPVTLTDKRFEAVDFLQPMGTETLALFLPVQGFDERQWLSFLYPLRPDTWAFLAINSVALVTLLKAFQMYCYGWNKHLLLLNPKSLIGDFWMFLMSYIGRPPSMSYASSHLAIKVLLLVSFLAGSIVSMSYRASLTAALSVQKAFQPFKSIDEVLQSQYRVIYFGHLDYYLANFYSPHNSLGVSEWVKLSNERVVPLKPKNQYTKVFEAIDELLSTDIPTTLWFFKESIAYFMGERCLLTEAYSNNFPAQVSFAFPKRSPYTEIMNYQIMKLWENGAISTLKKEHIEIGQYCRVNEREVKSLSMEKLTSLFTILLVGVTISLMLLVIEQLAKRSRQHVDNKFDTDKDESKEALDRLLREFGVVDQGKFKTELNDILKSHFA